MATADPSPPEGQLPATAPARRSWSVLILWVLPALGILSVLAYGFFTRESADVVLTAPRVGKPLPDFTLPDLQGRTVQLTALRGKIVFVNVWATWCPPCIEEMPTIQQLYERLRPQGLEVLAVSLDALGAQVVGPFMQSRRLTFPALLDVMSTLQRVYRTTGVPESFIVDRNGLLVEKIIGPRDWVHPQMLALFERLLSGNSPRSQ